MATTNTDGNGGQGKAGKAGGASKGTPKPTAGTKAGAKAETGAKQGKAAGTSGAKPAAKGAAAGSGSAGKDTGKAAGGKAGGGKTAKGGGAGRDELRGQLRDFVQRHPRGWGHGEWSGLIEDLRGRGQDVSNTDALGMDLERERLSMTLEQISGVGPARVRSIADSFGRLYDLRQASVDEIAERAGVPRSVAEKVRGALH